MKQARVACESCLHVLQSKFGDKGQSGGPLGAEKLISDITELKKMYEKLAEKPDADQLDKFEAFITTSHKIQGCLVEIEKQATTFADRTAPGRSLQAKATREKIERQLTSLNHFKEQLVKLEKDYKEISQSQQNFDSRS